MIRRSTQAFFHFLLFLWNFSFALQQSLLPRFTLNSFLLFPLRLFALLYPPLFFRLCPYVFRQLHRLCEAIANSFFVRAFKQLKERAYINMISLLAAFREALRVLRKQLPPEMRNDFDNFCAWFSRVAHRLRKSMRRLWHRVKRYTGISNTLRQRWVQFRDCLPQLAYDAVYCSVKTCLYFLLTALGLGWDVYTNVRNRLYRRRRAAFLPWLAMCWLIPVCLTIGYTRMFFDSTATVCIIATVTNL